MEKGKLKYVLTTGAFALVSGGVLLAGLLMPTTSAKADNAKEFTVCSINKSGMKKVGPVLTEEVKLEEDGDGTYEIPGDSEYAIIKQGNGTVAVWTEEPLADADQFRTDYIANPDRDPSIKDDDTFVPISGYGSYDLNATLGNPWGTYSFTKDPVTGNIVMVTSPDKISHLNYGTGSKTTPTPTPSDPGTTPTPSDPGQTPTPTVPGTTPTPNTTSYPKTGYNDKNMSIRERFMVNASTMTKEEKISTIAGLGIIGAASVGVATYEVIKHVKSKRRNYNHR